MIRLSFIPYRNQLFSLTFVVNISEENISVASITKVRETESEEETEEVIEEV